MPTLHGHFEEQARCSPDRVALWYQGASISYADLDRRANQLAARLGVPPGSFVGLHLDRSIDYVIAMLGVLKANCAVVPLPPSYPEARLRAILAFADLSAVVDSNLAIRTYPSVHRDEHAAFVLASSGSTGKPKLIVRSHASFFHRLKWTWSQHPYQPDDVCVQKSFMTTTHAIYELFEPLLQGVTVHILADQEVRDLEGFWDTIRARRITRLLIAPSLLQASLDMPGFAAPPLRQMVLMGEYVPPALAGRLTEAFPRATRIFSIYGSTEASSTLVCDIRASYQSGQRLPLGEPIAADIAILVEDEELYIGGPALFSAYLKDPALTDSTHVTRNGQRFFRTSDRVRRLADGQLEFMGRADDTVKVRGFRVDLLEVEREAAKIPGVRQAVALLHSNGSLLLFVTPATIPPLSALQTLRETLPGYAVPSVVLALEAFPLLPSGKIDRAGLLGAYIRHAPGSPFRSETERRVAAIWAEVVGHDAFSSRDNFFDIGGTSLLVLAVVHRLRSAFSLTRQQLGDVSIYQNPTLRSLAYYLDTVRAGAPVAAQADTVLVTLRQGESAEPPVFIISSAGGTLGAYAKLVKALDTRREVIGVRDPFNWDDRDPTLGFQAWVACYVEAIRARQPNGPYHIVAYSSAGSFGYEVARHLEEVALLVLIDPLAMDRATKGRFGYWALEARFMGKLARMMVGLVGRLLPMQDRGPSNWTMTREEFEQLADRARHNSGYIRMLSSLLELNTGLPFALTREEEGSVQALLDKVKRVAPETDLALIEHIVVQYEMQVRAQHNFRLSRYDGDVVLFEPQSAWSGIVPAQVRPYVRNLRAEALPIGSLDQKLLEGFPHSMRTHYLSMRDDLFVGELAKRLSDCLRRGVMV